jgi:hypothetical protein
MGLSSRSSAGQRRQAQTGDEGALADSDGISGYVFSTNKR